jgi:HEAT repeat protein
MWDAPAYTDVFTHLCQMEEEDETVPGYAARMLGFADNTSVIPLLQELRRQSSHSFVREQATDALQRLGVLESDETVKLEQAWEQLAYGDFMQSQAVLTLVQNPSDEFLERMVALYDQGVLVSNAREILAEWSVYLSRQETPDTSLLPDLLKRLICDKHLPARERAGQALGWLDKAIGSAIYHELLTDPDEWKRACGVRTLGFWDTQDERIQQHRYDESFVIRYFVDQALETYRRRDALEEHVARFHSGDNLQRLNAYLVLRDKGDKHVIRRLQDVIEEHAMEAIYMRQLLHDINDRFKKQLEKRAKEEAEVFKQATTIKFD